jgi:DNA-nicking Smr family endonuclease
MRQKPPANKDLDEDQILWQLVTQRVTPLPGRSQPPSLSPTVKKLAHFHKPATKTSKRIPMPAGSSPANIKPSSPVDLREGDRAGLDSRTQRRLFRGDVPIDRRLDLHGHTAARAEIKLQTFLEDASHAGCRCVLVITGKGAGVLKGHMPGWLKRPPLSGLVLALAEARPVDGGNGAFYVLLRRRR